MRRSWGLVKSVSQSCVWGYRVHTPHFRALNAPFHRRFASNRSVESDNLLYREIEWAENTLQPSPGAGIRNLSKNQRQRLSHIIQGARNSKDPKLHKKVSSMFFRLFGRLIHQSPSYGSRQKVATPPEYGVLPSSTDCNAIIEILVELEDIKGLRRTLGMCRRSGIDTGPIATTRAMMCFAKADCLSDSLLCLRELLRMCNKHLESTSSSIDSEYTSNNMENDEDDGEINDLMLSRNDQELLPSDTHIPSTDLLELVPWSVAMPALDSLVTCSVRKQDLDSTCMVLTSMVRLRMPPDSRTVNRIIMAASKQAEERWDSSFSKLRLSRKLASKNASNDDKHNFLLNSDRSIETPLEASWNWFWWLHEYLQLPIDMRNVNLLLRQAGAEDPYEARMLCGSVTANERFAFTADKLCQRTFAVYHRLWLLMQQKADEDSTRGYTVDGSQTADETTLYYLLRASGNAADKEAFLAAVEVAEENRLLLSPKTCGSIVRILAGTPASKSILTYFLDYTSKLPTRTSEYGNSAKSTWSESRRMLFLDDLKKSGRKTLNKTLNYWTMEAFHTLRSVYETSDLELATVEAAELAILSVSSESLNQDCLSQDNRRYLERCCSVLDATHIPTDEERQYWSNFFGNDSTFSSAHQPSIASTHPDIVKSSIQASCAAAVLSMVQKLKHGTNADTTESENTLLNIKNRMERKLSLAPHRDSYFDLVPMQVERMKLYQRFSRAFDVDVVTRLLPEQFSNVLDELKSGPLASISTDAFGLLGPSNDTELQLSSSTAAIVQSMDQQALQYVLQLLSRSTSDPSLVRSLILIFLEFSKHATLHSQKVEHLNAAGYAAMGPQRNPQPAGIAPTTWLRMAQAAESSGQYKCSLWLLQCGIASEAFSYTMPPVDNDLEMGRLLVDCSHGLSKREAQRRKDIKSNIDTSSEANTVPATLYRGRQLQKYYGMLPEDDEDNFLFKSLKSLVHMGGATGCFDLTFPGDQVIVVDASSVVSKEATNNDFESFNPRRSYLSGKWIGHLLQAYLPMLRLRLQKIWDHTGIAPPGLLLHGKADSLEQMTIALMDCWPLKKPLYHTQLHTQPWLYASPSQVSDWIDANREIDQSNSENGDINADRGDALATAIVWANRIASKEEKS